MKLTEKIVNYSVWVLVDILIMIVLIVILRVTFGFIFDDFETVQSSVIFGMLLGMAFANIKIRPIFKQKRVIK